MAIEKRIYNRGEWVRLVGVLPTDYNEEDYGKYLKKFVKIANTSSTMFNFTTTDSNEIDLALNLSWVERLVTEEELLRIEKKIAKKKERKLALLAKEKEGIIYKPQDVGALAVDIFGGDRVKWDENSVMIYFPEFEMTNSKDDKHLIKELYIKYIIEPSILYGGWEIGSYKARVSMMGIRGSLSLKEWQSNYGHSHMNVGNAGWGNFCVGKSEYSILLQNIQLSLLEQDWNMLFLSLENYLVWESLEGGPYCKIGEMKYSKSVNHNSIGEELNRILPDAPKEIWDFSEEGLLLNSGHPLLGEYFNSTSKIRDANSYTKEEAEIAVKEELKKLKQNRKNCEIDVIEWGEEKRKPIIYYEEIDEGTQKPISKNIMDEYCNILSKKGKEFIKKYTHGRAKQNNYQKVFGQSGA